MTIINKSQEIKEFLKEARKQTYTAVNNAMKAEALGDKITKILERDKKVIDVIEGIFDKKMEEYEKSMISKTFITFKGALITIIIGSILAILTKFIG